MARKTLILEIRPSILKNVAETEILIGRNRNPDRPEQRAEATTGNPRVRQGGASCPLRTTSRRQDLSRACAVLAPARSCRRRGGSPGERPARSGKRCRSRIPPRPLFRSNRHEKRRRCGTAQAVPGSGRYFESSASIPSFTCDGSSGLPRAFWLGAGQDIGGAQAKPRAIEAGPVTRSRASASNTRGRSRSRSGSRTW